MSTIDITIKGAGGTINYPTEVIIKALTEAGLKVEFQDEHRSDDPDALITLIKDRIDSGQIKDWKVIIKTEHCPWGG